MSAYPAWWRLRRIGWTRRDTVWRPRRNTARTMRIALMTWVVGRSASLIVRVSWHFNLFSFGLEMHHNW